MARNLFAFILVVLAACEHGICARHSDCAHDQACSARGVCVSAPDAGAEAPDTDADTSTAADAATEDAP